MTAERLTGGEAIVRGLLDHGVDTVFALPVRRSVVMKLGFPLAPSAPLL